MINFGIARVLTKAPALARIVNPTITIARRHGPEILQGVGVVGVVATAVLASRATLKLEEEIDKLQFDVGAVRDLQATQTVEQYPAPQQSKDLTKAYIAGAGRITKLYLPTVTMGAVTIACFLGSHGIMRQRNVAIAAAYKTLELGFDNYRKRVVEDLGEDKDRDYRLGLVDEVTTDKKTGEETRTTSVDPNRFSPYIKFFDEGNPNWSKTPEYSLLFLRQKQNYFNDLLKARGHVFLNEVYYELGFEHTQAGASVGWALRHPDSDQYVDFGIYDFESEKARQFINGEERNVILDFNVDGVILNYI